MLLPCALVCSNILIPKYHSRCIWLLHNLNQIKICSNFIGSRLISINLTCTNQYILSSMFGDAAVRCICRLTHQCSVIVMFRKNSQSHETYV